MWFIFRLAIIPIIYLIYSTIKKPRNFQNNQNFQNDQLIEEKEKNKHNIIVKYLYYLKSSNQLTFKLKQESFIANLFKNLGLTKEYSVGNEAFDQLVYIECDDPQVLDLLKNDQDLIQNLLKLFQSKINFISFDQGYIHVETKHELSEIDQQILYLIKVSVDDAQLASSNIQKTLIFTKLTMVEFLIWTIAGQGVVGAIEFMMSSQTQYESIELLLWYSLGFWFFLFCFSLLIIRLVLGTSSVNVYAVSELLILAVLLYPLASYSILSDYNMSFDRSTPHQVACTLIKHREVIHRGKRSTTHSYYFDLEKKDQSQFTIQVPLKQYQQIDISHYDQPSIAIVYGGGRFNIPWIKEVLILNHQ
jgi:hypothetical protein